MTAIEPIITYDWVFCVCVSVHTLILVCFPNWSVVSLGQELCVIYFMSLKTCALIQSISEDFKESLLNE